MPLRTLFFDIKKILQELESERTVTITDDRLVCSDKRNDLVALLDLFLQQGYRRLTESDLKVGARLVRLEFDDGMLRELVKRPTKKNISVLGVRIVEVHTPEQITKKRKKLARKDSGIARFVRSLGPAVESLYVLVIDDAARGSSRGVGSVGESTLLLGRSSPFPTPVGERPKVLSEVYIVKE